MAFQSYSTEEELKKQQEALAGQNQTGIVSNQSNAITATGQSASATQTPTAAGAPAEGKGTGWVNLQNYLSANQGGGAAIADKVLGGAQDQISSAVTDINNQATKGVQAAQGGTVVRNTGLENQLKKDPLKVDQKAYSDYVNSGYKGPNQFSEVEGYQDVLNKFKGANDLYKNLQTQDGRETALAKSLNDPRYTKGMSYLDGYLMQEEGQPKVQAFNEKNKDLEKTWDNASSQFDTQKNSAVSESERNKGYAKSAAQSARDQLQADANAKLAALNATRGDINQQVDFTDISENQGSNFRGAVSRIGDFGIDKSKFYTPDTTQYQLGDAVSPEERARMAALADLLGEENGFAAAQTSQRSGPVFDEAGYQKAVQEARRKQDGANQSANAKALAQSNQDSAGGGSYEILIGADGKPYKSPKNY